MIIPAFLLGAAGSLHCLGMCGPVAFMLPLHRANPFKAIIQASLYHFGRLFSYTALGLCAGILGKGLLIFATQQKISLLIGSVMILSIVLPTKWISRKLGYATHNRLIFKLRSALSFSLRQRNPEAFLAVGLLNGLLPCGLVFMATLGALASGDALEASAFMLAFGLGTIPLMSAVLLLGKLARVSVKDRVRKFIPAIVALIGLLFILRGLGLGIPYLSPAPLESAIGSTLECHP